MTDAPTHDVVDGVEPVLEDVVGWRRHLHRHPELSFEERETAAYIADALAGFGEALEVERPAENSVVAHLRTGRPGPVVALRADIDALPIDEQSGVDFASENAGVMHACGHDGHTAMLLGAARLLTEARDRLPGGEIRFLFQPAEELAPGGARDLVAAGAVEGVDFIYGCHLWTPLEYGKVAAVPGAFMAASDFFTPADVEWSARTAAQRAFEREHFDGVGQRATTDDFLGAIASAKPTLTREMIDVFQSETEQFRRV